MSLARRRNALALAPIVTSGLYHGARHAYNYVSKLRKRAYGGMSPFDYARGMARAHKRANNGPYKVRSTNSAAPKSRTRGKWIGRGQLAGKIRKPFKRVKRAPKYKMSQGVEIINEWGKVVDDENCQYIGHITHPQQTVIKTMWCAIAKKLMLKAGSQFSNLTQPLNIEDGDILSVLYTQDVTNTSIQQNFTLVSTDNILTLGANLAGGNYYSSGLATQQDVHFKAVTFFPRTVGEGTYRTLSQASIQLDQAYMSLDVKSSLKMQNRTVTTAADNEADDVDNCPLYGKVYAGPGTGAQLNSNTSTTKFLWGNFETGLIQTGADDDNDLQEPPPPFQFNEVKKYDKISVSPGEIKTSVLSYKKTMLFNSLNSMLVRYQTGITSVKRKIGKFRIYALEKVLDSQEGLPPITVALEHNYVLNAMLVERHNYRTAPQFTKVYV